MLVQALINGKMGLAWILRWQKLHVVLVMQSAKDGGVPVVLFEIVYYLQNLAKFFIASYRLLQSKWPYL